MVKTKGRRQSTNINDLRTDPAAQARQAARQVPANANMASVAGWDALEGQMIQENVRGLPNTTRIPMKKGK